MATLLELRRLWSDADLRGRVEAALNLLVRQFLTDPDVDPRYKAWAVYRIEFGPGSAVQNTLQGVIAHYRDQQPEWFTDADAGLTDEVLMGTVQALVAAYIEQVWEDTTSA